MSYCIIARISSWHRLVGGEPGPHIKQLFVIADTSTGAADVGSNVTISTVSLCLKVNLTSTECQDAIDAMCCKLLVHADPMIVHVQACNASLYPELVFELTHGGSIR